MGLIGVPFDVCLLFKEFTIFSKKHLQKYIEKNPRKNNTRRSTVNTTVTGGAGSWENVASVIDDDEVNIIEYETIKKFGFWPEMK